MFPLILAVLNREYNRGYECSLRAILHGAADGMVGYHCIGMPQRTN